VDKNPTALELRWVGSELVMTTVIGIKTCLPSYRDGLIIARILEFVQMVSSIGPYLPHSLSDALWNVIIVDSCPIYVKSLDLYTI
jgi:hypothetical protein